MPKANEQNSIVAIIEGRLRDKQKDKILLDISDGVTIELPAQYVAKVDDIADQETQRNFVRVQVKDPAGKADDEIVFRVNPRMMSIVKESRGVPLPFVTGSGMAFGAGGTMETGPERDLIGGGAGLDGQPPVMPLGSWSGGKTTCMWSTCTASTASGWSVQCDQSAGDIRADDPGEVEVEPL